MKLSRIFKRDKEKEEPKKMSLTQEQRISRAKAIKSHQVRIDNLGDELEQLSINLKYIEEDSNKSRIQKQKESDLIIRRMALIKYEIEIREGLIKWLS